MIALTILAIAIVGNLVLLGKYGPYSLVILYTVLFILTTLSKLPVSFE